MYIRKLGQTYASLTEGSWLRQAIPSFMFGMMTLKLTPLWNDATSAMKQIGETKEGEEALLALALDWLDVPSTRGSGPGGPPAAHRRAALTDFDCTNLQHLVSQADEIHQTAENALDLMLESFDKQQQTVDTRPANARSQALKVLAAMPALAEKRSRKLVPYFLSWAAEPEVSSDNQASSEEEDKEHASGAETWSFYDRKGMLGVFDQFINPRSLYESEKVYQALLHLMENGDIEVQKSALKAGEALKGSYGMELESDDVEDLVSLALGTLRAPEIEEAFANEVTQILIFLGPRLQARTRDEGPTAEALAEGDEEEAEDSRLEQRGKDLQYLFWKLSSILRQDVKSTSMGMVPKVVAMEVLETVCRRVPDENLAPSLKTILFPLQAITDPHASTPFSLDEGFKTKHDALKTRAQILMDALQKKFGTAEYTKQLLAIREEVRARRQARSSKRKIEAVAHPEKYSRDKRKKTEKKKMRNKVKGQEFKAYRQAYKSW
ncbi:hypothetical protein BN1723_013147, partial [Verticillium longisporum]